MRKKWLILVILVLIATFFISHKDNTTNLHGLSRFHGQVVYISHLEDGNCIIYIHAPSSWRKDILVECLVLDGESFVDPNIEIGALVYAECYSRINYSDNHTWVYPIISMELEDHSD